MSTYYRISQRWGGVAAFPLLVSLRHVVLVPQALSDPSDLKLLPRIIRSLLGQGGQAFISYLELPSGDGMQPHF